MPRKQKEPVRSKRIGFHILAVSVLTLVLVGGNTFLLLSPLFAASIKNKALAADNKNKAAMVKVMRPTKESEEQRTVYLVENSGRPTLLHSNKLYDYKQLANGVTSEYSEYSPATKLVKKPLLLLPEGREILRSTLSKDGTLLVFSISTIVNFEFLSNQNPVGQGEVLNTVFAYDIKQNKIAHLFSDNKLTKGKYPLPKLISDDNKYIAFDVFTCWGCEAPYPTTALADISLNNSVKELDRVSDFRWLPDGNFEYKDFIEEPCPQEQEFGECYKDPATLSFKKGSWK